MRVIAGRFGGRRLRAPAGRATRPTSERVREALFSMLGDITDTQVLDLFAGTGALGIEALSRGAARVVFAERDPAVLAVLTDNLAALGVTSSEAEVRGGDAQAALRSAQEHAETYDLVFIDPPYRHARAWSLRLQQALPPLLKPAARVVSESDRRSALTLPLELERERRYGDTLIRIHRNQ
jgi:16S rRNA (guanine966-N2)-methyltransferase